MFGIHISIAPSFPFSFPLHYASLTLQSVQPVLFNPAKDQSQILLSLKSLFLNMNDALKEMHSSSTQIVNRDFPAVVFLFTYKTTICCSVYTDVLYLAQGSLWKQTFNLVFFFNSYLPPYPRFKHPSSFPNFYSAGALLAQGEIVICYWKQKELNCC